MSTVNEFRVFGPPGTGKTTFLAAQIRNAVAKHGSDNVLVASFTRAAAAEIGGRDTQIDRGQVGTLHAICKRALGGDASIIAEGMLKEWNREHPDLAMSEDLPDAEEVGIGGGEGDLRYAELQVLRAKMRPQQLWAPHIRAFHKKWEQFKSDYAALDFTDLIEICLNEVDYAPGRPVVGFFDEVQDFTPLELALVRKWGGQMQTVLLAGDDDQCLYAFKGCSADAFLDPPVDDAHKRLLRQSYRVPRTVQALAQQWVGKLTRREDKPYLPRDEEGAFRVTSGSLRYPEHLLAHAEQYLRDGKRVMFLSSCAYLLDPLKYAMRHRGVPFHNPYRQKRGDWNPLATRRNATAAHERILAFAQAWQRDGVSADDVSWTGDELRKWTPLLKADDVLQRGAKTKLASMGGERLLTTEQLATYFQPEALAQARRYGLAWLEGHLVGSMAKPATFPLQVAKTRGLRALVDKPQIVLGTIHSVKGGEADVVYLFPDVSPAGYGEWGGGPQTRDSIIRQFYVGMTRAKETLIVGQSSGGPTIPLPRKIEHFEEAI